MQHDPALTSLTGFDTARRFGAFGFPFAPTLRPGPRLSRLISRFVLGLALLLLATAAGMFWLRIHYDGHIYPGIRVAGIDVGGENIAGARAAIERQAAAFVSAKASFTYQDKQWQPTLAELGVSVDARASLDQAIAIGREGDARARARSAWELLRDDRTIPLSVALDEGTLNRWFDEIDANLGIAPRDAALQVKDGKVTVVPEVTGVVVDRGQMKQLLVAALAGLQAPSGPLATHTREPRVRAADLDGAKQRLEQALAQPVQIRYQKQTWTLDAAVLGGYVVQQIDDQKTGADAVSLSLDRTALSKRLSDLLAGQIDHDPVDAVVGWNGTRAVSVKPSVDGTKLRPMTLADAVSASFLGDHRAVDVPVAVIKPKIDSDHLDRLGITTRLGVGSSNFDGSDPGRATNIQVGANLLNGYLVPPHQLFSFNHAIGAITPELGFVESNVIDGERIGRDVGGGICQVSTTVFRAAFEAGLPIDEWHPHRYRLGFYEQDDWPVGLDASILQPDGNPFGGGDFSFRNPSDSYILIESYTDGPRVVVVLYGPDLGYKVDVTGPLLGDTYKAPPDQESVDNNAPPGTVQMVEAALDGLDVTFNRNVYDRAGNLVDSSQFFTHFYPRPNLWKVSPDMKGQSPAALVGAST